MKITDVKTALLGDTVVVRLVTDEGLSGYGVVERTKTFVRPVFDFLAPYLVGEDPTQVERTMLKIRRLGGFKPWGKAVSTVEVALWDLAGKAAGLPVHRLLGGKVRDRVRVYNGGRQYPGDTLEEQIANLKAGPEGFTMMKAGAAFHGGMAKVPGFTYSETRDGYAYDTRGPLTEWALRDTIERAEKLKGLLGDDVALALDGGPGWTLPDAIKFAKAVEPLNLLWLEDLLTGDYTPHVSPRQYRDLTVSTTTPIHTGEQIYLRQNFVELVSTNAVRVIGPDPLDVGGLAELKWVAEYADLHGVLIAPHGTLDGLIGLAALVQVSATLPDNYLAFEYPVGRPDWWYDIVTGLPDPIVKDGFIEVWDTPGLGVDFDVEAARKYLPEQDKDFFD